MKTISCSKLDELIQRYISKGGEFLLLREGVLTLGDLILFDVSNTLNNFVIKEVYINIHSSTQSIISYRTLPKKYLKMIDELY